MTGEVRHSKFLKTQKYTEIRAFVDPKNILIAPRYMKTKGFIAFSATSLRYFGEKLSLALTLSNFLISNPKNIPIMLQIAYPKVYWTTFYEPKKCLTPPSLTNSESPPGVNTNRSVKPGCQTGAFLDRTVRRM